MKASTSFKIAASLLAALSFGSALAQTPQPVTHPVRLGTNDGPWWKHALIYEIYPRSFQDSNGDGTGDLNGITQRLDYLRSLGVDAIWISPLYPSPQIDFGYDISDYENVDPQYGTLADFDRLVTEAKKRNIRILMDMVLNHTSDQHRWFKESASSKDNPKRDWYVWRDGKAGGTAPDSPPNNWNSLFGHSAWKYDATTNQYFYHRFYPQQPDLNWRNPEVEKAMFGAMRFWLDRGVAGFRLDAITSLFEEPDLRNAKPTGGTNEFGDANQERKAYDDLPEEHDVARRMRIMSDSYPGDRVLIGETYLHDAAKLNAWYGGTKRDELHLPMDMQVGFPKKLTAATLRSTIGDAETKIDGNQPLFVFDNHDNHRSWDRFGDGKHNPEIARLIATVLLTTRATALMYYGQELGMMTSTPTRKEDVKDPIGLVGWPKEKGRDGERTPMQWDAAKNGGFSSGGSTWLPLANDYKTVNVASEERDPKSLLNWYKKLIAMRRSNRTLRDGEMTMIDTANPSVFSYVRKGFAGAPSVLVTVNVSAEPQKLSLDATATGAGTTLRTLLTDDPALEGLTDSQNITIAPYASWVGSVSAK